MINRSGSFFVSTFLLLLFSASSQPQQYDLIIRGGTIYNGKQVLKNGEHTGATPGRFVKGPGWKAGFSRQ